MSINRIKGDSGVIIESKKYLKLPSSSTADRPSIVKLGMVRYNTKSHKLECTMRPDSSLAGEDAIESFYVKSQTVQKSLKCSWNISSIYVYTENMKVYFDLYINGVLNDTFTITLSNVNTHGALSSGICWYSYI